MRPPLSRTTRGSVAGLCVILFCHSLRAEDSPYRLSYQAPGDCPELGEFARRVQQRSEHGRQVLDQSLARTMHVVIRRERGKYVGTLDFYDLEIRPVSRELTAVDCDPLIDALVLVTALAIDAQMPQARWLPGVELPDDYIGPRWPPLEPEPTPLAPVPPAPILREREFTVVGAMARVNTAAAPGWGGGVLGMVELRRSRGRPLVVLGATWGTGQAKSEGERARIDWLTAVAEFCPVAAALGRGVELLPCAGLEAGALLGSGDGSSQITYPETGQSTGWLAFALLGRLRVPLTPLFGLEMEAGATVPATRPVFQFEIPTVRMFQPPVVGLVTGLGLGFELE